MKNQQKMTEPQIRFKGFDEEWERIHLNTLGKCQSGIGFPEREQGGVAGFPFFKVSDMNHQENNFELIHSNNYVTHHQIKTNNWPLITDVPALVFAKVGAAVMLNRKRLVQESFLVDNNMMAFKFRKTTNPLYISYLFQTLYLPSLAQTGALPSINASDVEKEEVYHTSSFQEQKKIGDYFRRIDEMINEVKREIGRLEKMKQASLQKMFPRPGKTTPEIRFAGFNEPWKERQISDCASFSRGQGYTKNDLKNSGTPIFLYGRLYTKYSSYVESVDTYSVLTPISVISKGNEVVMPSSGETAEDIAVAAAILSKGIILGGGLNIIVPYEEIDQIFLALSLTYGPAHYDLAKKAQGKSVVHIYNDDIGDVNILFPSLEEQKAIGDYFRNLDALLSAKRQKLVKLRNVKKACLEKMFVNSSEL